MFDMPDRFADVERFETILEAVADYELQYILEHTGLKERELHSLSATPSPDRMRQLFEELGGAFVKLGQLLSLRPDLLPKEYCEAFAKLQDNVPTFDIEQRMHELEPDSFILQPIAAASIGQVHKAVIDGQQVAVKIRRPGIVDTMQTDIEIMTYFANLLDAHFNLDTIRPNMIVEEFKDYTRDELDYRVEARNLRRATQNAAYVETPELCMSEEDVLVMEFIDGVEAKDLEDRPEVAETLARSFFTQVFEHGWFHADPHPSNILVSGETVTLLDYGITGDVSDNKDGLGSLFTALLQRDVDGIVHSLRALDVVNHVDAALREDIRTTLAPYYDKRLEDVNMADAVREGLGLARRHDMQLPRDLVRLGKAVITLEGTCRHLDSSFNLVETGKKYVRDTATLTEQVTDVSYSYLSFLRDIPGMTRDAFAAVEDADSELQRIDEHITGLREEIHHAATHVTVALVAGSFLVSYALMGGSDGFFGFEKFSFAVFVTACVVLAVLALQWVEEQLGWAA